MLWESSGPPGQLSQEFGSSRSGRELGAVLLEPPSTSSTVVSGRGLCDGLSPREEGLRGMEDSLAGGLPLSVFPNPMSTRLVVIARHAVIKWHFCQILNVKGIYKISKILEQSVCNLQSP